MEKIPLDKSNSFTKNAQIMPTSPTTPHSVSFSDDQFTDVDQFTNAISTINDKSSSLPEVPDCIETLSKIVESRIAKYSSGEINMKVGKMTEEDSFFIEAVRRISKLTSALSEFSSDSNANPSLNQTSVVLQRAMAFLEEEFRALLEDTSRNEPDHENLPNIRKFSSFSSKNQQEHSDRCAFQREQDSGESDEYAAYPPELVVKLNKISTTMISGGYETECCQVYFIARRNAIKNQMNKLEFEKINMDEVVKMPWESLETEISRWIKVVKNCSDVIFPGEKKLGESVFSDYPLIFRNLSGNLVRVVVILLLDFVEATAMAKRSAEKLFKYLDMYETLQNLIPAIRGESCSDELMEEVVVSIDRIGESAASIFCELENSIKGDAARTSVPGGAVHPLTRYVMNYLKYACEYKDTLEKIFEKHAELENKYIKPQSNHLSSHDIEKEGESPHDYDTASSTTPFSIQVVMVMDLLDANLEQKSKLYRDPSLCYVFLMNNGRYILQKVKGSTEIRQVMGDTWCRRKSTIVRQYHKNYQRETWNRVLQCLNHEGLSVNGKVNKPLLKERFKIFTTTFDEIHRTQSMWVVSDEQLQSELRISISSVVIPAYRSFVGRFKQHLDSGKQADKYIKYQPEDIETLIEGLFEGNTASMARRKT
ncbi:hypothetical protein BUALT_Bualt17G0013400 [Buddleja alternifolia]|uniref:Exocyst subunit Exo70 family protein n=1 Tax=Buddleja alternifolia TaxID=168488 RepID=A0AAV6WEN8_9LAMI|nr:hypothetical protein BUALT_Bualt17G0013400 [Buddleja alternifolia]